MLTDNPQQEEQGCATTCGHDETPSGDHEWVEQKGDVRKAKEMSPEKEQEGGVWEAERDGGRKVCSSVSTLR